MPSYVLSTNLGPAYPLVARGKVRDIYQLSEDRLLFVATDRISAYDVVMKNVIHTFSLPYDMFLYFA